MDPSNLGPPPPPPPQASSLLSAVPSLEPDGPQAYRHPNFATQGAQYGRSPGTGGGEQPPPVPGIEANQYGNNVNDGGAGAGAANGGANGGPRGEGRPPSPYRSPSGRRPMPASRKAFNEPSAEPSNVLGIFGLSMQTRERDLEQEFGKHGVVEKVVIVYDQRTDRSRGFGFVTMNDCPAATRCIEELNGLDLHGRRIRVDFSTTHKPHNPTPGQYMGVRRPGDDDRDRGSYRSDRYDDRDQGRRDRPRSRDRDRRSGYRDRDAYQSSSRRSRSPSYRSSSRRYEEDDSDYRRRSSHRSSRRRSYSRSRSRSPSRGAHHRRSERRPTPPSRPGPPPGIPPPYDSAPYGVGVGGFDVGAVGGGYMGSAPLGYGPPPPPPPPPPQQQMNYGGPPPPPPPPPGEWAVMEVPLAGVGGRLESLKVS